MKEYGLMLKRDTGGVVKEYGLMLKRDTGVNVKKGYWC